MVLQQQFIFSGMELIGIILKSITKNGQTKSFVHFGKR